MPIEYRPSCRVSLPFCRYSEWPFQAPYFSLFFIAFLSFCENCFGCYSGRSTVLGLSLLAYCTERCVDTRRWAVSCEQGGDAEEHAAAGLWWDAGEWIGSHYFYIRHLTQHHKTIFVTARRAGSAKRRTVIGIPLTVCPSICLSENDAFYIM